MVMPLSTELAAAQDGVTRQPIIEIKAGQFIDDIPFHGQRLDQQLLAETNPSLITHSSGRLCAVNILSNGSIQYIFTDVDRLEFHYVDTGLKEIKDVALYEMSDGNIALLWTKYSNATYYVCYGVLTPEGVWIRSGNLPSLTGSKKYAPALCRMADGSYLAMVLNDIPFTVSNGGTYTGITTSTIYLKVTADGTNTTALWQWRKDQNAWSSDITATGSDQSIGTEGVTVKFGVGQYYAGQEYWFMVVPGTPATGAIIINSIPNDGDTLTIGSTVYTFKAELTLPAIENEIKIDTLSTEITTENLRCALSGGTYEGTGEGVRYSTGTMARTDMTAIRTRNRLDLTSIAKGSSVNIVITAINNTAISTYSVTGGGDSSIDSVSGTPTNVIKKTVSSDMQSWGEWVDLLIPGITSTRNKTSLYLYTLQDGKVMLWFDIMTQGAGFSTAVYNVSYTESADYGDTWTDAVQVTSYNLPSKIAKNAKIVQKYASDIILVYDEVMSCLRITKDTVGWDTTATLAPTELHYDDATGMLYAVCSWTGAGNKVLHGAVKIDTTTWSIVRFWNDYTIPAYNKWFSEATHCSYLDRGAGKWMVKAASTAYYDSAVLLIDGETDNIYQLFFQDIQKYNISKNVDGTFDNLSAARCCIDTAHNRLWVLFTGSQYTNRQIRIGYFDLSQFGGPTSNNYTFTDVINEVNQLEQDQLLGLSVFDGVFQVFPEAGLIAVAGEGIVGDAWGWLKIWTIDDGAVYRFFSQNTHEFFPYRGLCALTYANGRIFGGFTYESTHNDASYRGMLEIDLSSEHFYLRCPNFLNVDDMKMRDILTTQDGNLVMTLADLGVAVYNLNSGTWTLYNNDNIPGIYPGNGTSKQYTGPVAYDNNNSIIYFGNNSALISELGVTGFSIYGRMERSYYTEAQYQSGIGWVFGTFNPLVAGITDSDASISLEPNTNSIYIFWTKYTKGVGKTYWDKESGLVDLMHYLVRGAEIKHKRSIDGTPAEFSFSLSNGHQFDPSNTMSLLSKHIKKGKMIQLRWGERIGDVDYWQSGYARFIICKSSLKYCRGEYPIMSVTCEDRRTLWDNIAIIASPIYETTMPDDALIDIISEYGGFNVTEIDIEVLDDCVALGTQFIDKSLKEIVTDIVNRFGYFLDVTPYGDKVICRKVDLNKDPDHIYTGSQKTVDFSPDDSYSDFTNRVTVKGQSGNEIQVLFAEERVGGISGTVGFWKRKDTRRVWFSDDKSRRCLHPRIDVQESASSIAFALAGKCKEYICYEDPDHKYVDIKIQAPNLIGEILSGLGMYLAGKAMPPSVHVVTNTGGGYIVDPADSKIGSLMKDTGLWLILQCLSAIGNYQIDVYASPVGYVKQSFQASADDYEMQNLLKGTIVEQTLDDPLCHTVQECQKVADYEMSIVKAQRNRLKLTKITHLQDEPGDKIRIDHPFNKAAIDIFITDITRTMLVPEAGGEGYFHDEIEGWKV